MIVGDEEWARWEADRTARNQEHAACERERWRRSLPLQVEALTDRAQELDMQLYLTREFLQAALQLVRERDEDLRFERMILGAVLEENRR